MLAQRRQHDLQQHTEGASGDSLISDGDQAALAVPIPARSEGPMVRSLGIAAPSRRLTGRSIDRAIAVTTDIAGLLRGVRT